MGRPRGHSCKGWHWLLVLASICSLAACVPAPTVPMASLEYQQHKAKRADNLLILLRGIGASNKAFEERGLIEEVRQRKLPFDIIAPDAHFGYYRSETLEQRLHEDIILPARRLGYQKIWLAGFSMGGLGSLFYLRAHSDLIDGVILICPFLGWGGIIDEIEEAGGLAAWTAVTDESNDWQRFLWSWLKHYSTQIESFPPVYLGFGADDFIAGQGPALLAKSLPDESVFSVPGGHTYATFKKVFTTHLDNLNGILRDQDPSRHSSSAGKATGREVVSQDNRPEEQNSER